MTKRSIVHATFVIERTYDAAPKRVFAAWADPKIKAKWFGAPTVEDGKRSFDFRVGGRETSSGKVDGKSYSYVAQYQDIIPNERIIYTYDMLLEGERISVSVASIEFKPAGSGTKMTVTEQGAYLDGLDNPDLRESGTKWLMDQLGEVLKGNKDAVAPPRAHQ